MKKLEYTDEHRHKLLEMVRKLFPEYIHSSLGSDVDGDEDEIHIAHYIYSDDGLPDHERGTYIEFHWYEFCLTILLQEVCKRLIIQYAYNDEQSKFFEEQLVLNIIIVGENPIDYLFRQFERIN